MCGGSPGVGRSDLRQVVVVPIQETKLDKLFRCPWINIQNASRITGKVTRRQDHANPTRNSPRCRVALMCHSIPSVLFHATPAEFETFDTSAEGVHFGSLEQAQNLKNAGVKRIIAARLLLKNPLRVPDLGTWTFQGVHAHLSRERVISNAEADELWFAWQSSDTAGWNRLKQVLEQHGYDGFVYANQQEGPGDSFVAFHSHQIQIISQNLQCK